MKHWRKSWSYDNIFGSSRFDFDAAQRGVWNDLLDLADISRVKRGLISPAEGQAYTHAYIAGILNVPLELLNATIALCIKKERVIENGSGIGIVNWNKYQSDYDRQKPYRQGNQEGKGTNKKCPSCDYKGKTSEESCPNCKALLEKDYKAGRHGHMVKD